MRIYLIRATSSPAPASPSTAHPCPLILIFPPMILREPFSASVSPVHGKDGAPYPLRQASPADSYHSGDFGANNAWTRVYIRCPSCEKKQVHPAPCFSLYFTCTQYLNGTIFEASYVRISRARPRPSSLQIRPRIRV